MSKQTLFVTLTAAVVLCGCQSSKVKISGRFVGSDARSIYLEQVTPQAQTIVDSTLLDAEGGYRFLLRGVERTPSLYNVVYNGERIPLLLAGGDRVTLGSVGSVIRNYTVEGSAESALLGEFYRDFVAGAQQLDRMAVRFAHENLSEAERKQLAEELRRSQRISW